MHSCLAADVWLGAATIELKRLETYSIERMSDACCVQGFCFCLLVSLRRYDYCFSGICKTRASCVKTPPRQARTSLQPHQVVAKRPASYQNPSSQRVGKSSCRRAAGSRGPLRASRRAKTPSTPHSATRPSRKLISTSRRRGRTRPRSARCSTS